MFRHGRSNEPVTTVMRESRQEAITRIRR